MTPLALLVSLAGLSNREAATVLGCRVDSVNSMSSGRRGTPDGMLAELRRLIAAQERAADEAMALIAQQHAAHPDMDGVDVGYPADDHEAQALGWPCVGAWQAMAARVIARSPVAVRLVPRGSTLATAGAAEAHGK